MTQNERYAQESFAQLGAALQAREQVRELASGAKLLAVLDAALRAGWLARLSSGITVSDLAEREGVSERRVQEVVDALTAAGIATTADGVTTLEPQWRALVDGASGVQLDVALAHLELERTTLQTVIEPADVDPDAWLTIARDWGLIATPAAAMIYQGLYGQVPRLHAALQAGGPFLDIGSGIGGLLISTALLYDDLQAVGVEKEPGVAAELTARVVAAGVADRVEVAAVDARELGRQEEFAVAFWAQDFFHPDVRVDALRAAFLALKPGGLLVTQELSVVDAQPTLPQSLDRLVSGAIGTSHGATADELVVEVSAAGFAHLETLDTPAGRLVVFERPAQV